MYKIMLADDEGIVIDALKFIIQKEFGESCEIAFAKTGRSVIELAETFRPDIAFMDIQMPGINGIEAIREIKQYNANTVFVVMSAYDKFDYAKEAINLGVLDYLNKPVEKNKIVTVLQKAMKMIDDEREKRAQDLIIREKLETVVPIIENGFIYNLLLQDFFEEDIDNFKNLLGLSEKYGFVGVLVFGESQIGNHMTNAVGTSVRVQNQFAEVREIVKGYFKCMIGNVMANKITIFVPMEGAELEYNERIAMIDKAREMMRKLKARLDVNFRMGIGHVHQLEEGMKSYHQAVQAITQMNGSVAHVDDLPIHCDYEENYPVKLEKDIFDATEKGDVDRQSVAVNQFYKWMVGNYSDCLSNIKIKILEFVLWAEHLSYERNGRTYHFKSREDYLPTVMEINDQETLGSWFHQRMEEAVKSIANNKEEHSNSVITKAKTYIKSNYGKDISLDDVSREVNISPYYFSKIFKEEVGVNFIDYLTTLRINKAKELLSSSNYSMKEICAKVGYADPNYFSRSFKKNVGLTPTEYKEENAHENL